MHYTFVAINDDCTIIIMSDFNYELMSHNATSILIWYNHENIRNLDSMIPTGYNRGYDKSFYLLLPNNKFKK